MNPSCKSLVLGQPPHKTKASQVYVGEAERLATVRELNHINLRLGVANCAKVSRSNFAMSEENSKRMRFCARRHCGRSRVVHLRGPKHRIFGPFFRYVFK